MGPVGRKCSEAFQEADAEKQKDVWNQGSASVVSALQDSWTSVLPLRVSIRHFCLQRGVLGQAKQPWSLCHLSSGEHGGWAKTLSVPLSSRELEKSAVCSGPVSMPWSWGGSS